VMASTTKTRDMLKLQRSLSLRFTLPSIAGILTLPMFFDGGRSFAVHPCGSLARVCGASDFLFPLIDSHAGGLPVGVGGRRHETMVLPALRH